MKKALIILSILFIQITYCFGQTNAVYFEIGSYELTSQTKRVLDSVFLEIQKVQKQEQMALIGYTDSDGTTESNQTLSLNRAREVKEYLQDKGLKNRINLFAKGEIQLAKDTGTKAAKLQSRRVEIIQNYSNNNDAFKSLEQEFQDFVISTDKDITLTCEKGTKIKISKGSFEGIDTTKEVIFKVQEYYSKASFISANLSSITANGELLESRGMLNIEAFQEDKKLTLKKGKAIEIEFKDRKEGDSTQLFNGIEQNGKIVWELSTNSYLESNMDTNSDQSIRIVRGFTKGMEIHEIYARGKNEMSFVRLYGSKKLKLSEIEAAFNSRSKDKREVENIKSMLVSQNLGWINCDRFYEATQKNDLIVEYQGNFVPDVFLIFTNINSVLPVSYIDGNKIVFRNVPINMNVKLVGVFKSEDMEKTYFANLKTKTREGFEEKLEFELLSKNELKSQINQL
jgi:hypothetical protein